MENNINTDNNTRQQEETVQIGQLVRRCLSRWYWFALSLAVCLALGALGVANMWVAIFADVGVMVLAVLNAIRALIVKKL